MSNVTGLHLVVGETSLKYWFVWYTMILNDCFSNYISFISILKNWVFYLGYYLKKNTIPQKHNYPTTTKKWFN